MPPDNKPLLEPVITKNKETILNILYSIDLSYSVVLLTSTCFSGFFWEKNLDKNMWNPSQQLSSIDDLNVFESSWFISLYHHVDSYLWSVCATSKQYNRDRSVYAPSQWETTLQCNAFYHWLGVYTEWSLLQCVVYCSSWCPSAKLTWGPHKCFLSS